MPSQTQVASPRNDASAAAKPRDDAFQALVQKLNHILGPCLGLDSAAINPLDLHVLMQEYTSRRSEWVQYAFADRTRPFARNLVHRGNGHSNLLVLVWTPGGESPVHDHANSHCIMKILQGSLKETLFGWPPDANGTAPIPKPLQIKKETWYEENQVTYMSDELGLHKLSNPNPEEVAVSLHLYTPPNAATFGCHVFDEASGEANHVTGYALLSESGRRVGAA